MLKRRRGGLPPALVLRLALPLLLQLPLPAAAWEEKLPDDPMQDDDTGAIERVRKRLDAKDNATMGTLGVVMVAGPKDSQHSPMTVPLWREYCRRHGMGFFLQEEKLSTDYPFEWTKPRVLMEIVEKVGWKYLLVVDSNTVPKNIKKSWEYMIKQYMRYKRFQNDKTMERYIFCPWDCDEEYNSPFEEGACTAPQLSGCILWTAKRAKTRRLLRSWYVKRLQDDLPSEGAAAVLKAFEQMKELNYEEVFYKDVQQDVGRKRSKFIPAFGWDKEYGWSLRDQIHDYIKAHPELARLSNKLFKQREAEL